MNALPIVGFNGLYGLWMGGGTAALSGASAVAGSSAGLGIGIISGMVVYPLEVGIDYFCKVDDTETYGSEPKVYKNREWKSVADVIKIFSAAVVNAAIFGGCILMGVTTLPIGATLGGLLITHYTVSRLENIALRHSSDLKPIVAILTLSVKVAVLAVALLTFVSLGILTPPGAILFGLVLGGTLVIGTRFAIECETNTDYAKLPLD